MGVNSSLSISHPHILKCLFNSMNKAIYRVCLRSMAFSHDHFPSFLPLSPPVRCYNPSISLLSHHLFTSLFPFTEPKSLPLNSSQIPALTLGFLPLPPQYFLPAFPVLPHALPARLPSSLKLIKTGLIRLLFKQCDGQTDAVNS